MKRTPLKRTSSLRRRSYLRGDASQSKSQQESRSAAREQSAWPAPSPAGQLKQLSKKRAADERRYLKRSREWLVGKCCACCGRAHEPGVFELTVQHLKGRRGALLLDEAFWLPLCWEPCHRRATTEPEWALENGFALRRVS